METIFEFLFKYRPILFQEGEFTFASPWPVLLILAGVAVVTMPALLTYGAARGDSRGLDRAVMAGLRLGLVAILVFILFQPTLVLTSVVPQRNFVGILIDDSQSMRISDEDGVARSDFVQSTFGSEGSELLTALSEKFTLRFFRFSRDASRLNDMADLSYSGTATDLGNAMVRAQEELAGVPISGLVVISDGADNSGEALAESLLPLQAANVPVYTVGLGEEELSPDVQLSRVEMPRTVLVGTSLVVDVIVSHRGYSERTVQLMVEDTGRLLASEDVTFERDGEPVVARVRIGAEDAGPRLLRFRVSAQEGERVTENNVRDVLVDVVNEAEKILYFEGEPRWEVKFLRRAVSDDENLQIVVLQRTAESKFLRLDVDDAEELAAGFPKTREELFRYRALILGSVEASFFTHDQLDMIADFVSQRGGGLLVLGGRNAFAEGSYQGTRLAEALPVFLDDELSTGAEPYFDELFITPTRTGLTHPTTQLGEDNSEAVRERWESLPPVTTLNPITRLKPGATGLLTGGTDEDRDQQVVLAYHRYGRGKVIALPIQDSWIWQMHADIPLEDQTHETFWRQLLRWLADGVPSQVEARSEREVVEPGQPVNLAVEVGDSAYAEVNDGNVVAVVLDPSGDSVTVPLDWDVEQDGHYDGGFPTTGPGLYEVSVHATRGGDTIGTALTYVNVAPSDDEYFDASMRGTTLRRVADQTGGLFYTPETVANLSEDISLTGAGVTLTEERDLWDMPILLLLVLGFMGGEWGYRRKRGTRMISRGILAIVMLFATAAVQPVLGQDTHVLVITGLGGDSVHRERFMEWGGALVDAAASEKFAIRAENIVYLGEDPAADPRIQGRSTRENVDRAFTDLASHSQPGDDIFVVLIGHGSYTGGESRFNLAGPDLTAEDFALHLDQLRDRRVAFANLTSASGEFVKALSGAGRAIVTATRTGRERNETVFGRYFIDAFSGESADLDKDGRVSLSEAFEFASTEVTREYETSNLIATEHAVLDDNGDGEGSTELVDAADGALARTMFLAADPTTAAARATDDPELIALYEQKADVERRIGELRALRGQIDQDRYDSDLEELLVELALTNRAIQGRGVGR